jgi:CheY-like chemotaxis protein
VSATTGKILIAEDDRAVREAVSRALRLEGYEVTAVADGAAALEHLRSTEAADLVILDVSDAFGGWDHCGASIAVRGNQDAGVDADCSQHDLGSGGRS